MPPSRFDIQNKRLHFSKKDRITLVIVKALSVRVVNHLEIANSETLLKRQRIFIKSFSGYKHKSHGRKPDTRDIKGLILEMRQNSYLCDCEKIASIIDYTCW